LILCPVAAALMMTYSFVVAGYGLAVMPARFFKGLGFGN
jgi:hypothetical protein